MYARGYRELIVWQKAMDLVDLVFEFTETLPSDQRFRLVDQMQRSAISIPSNIAEGYRRRTVKDTRHFFTIAFSSGAELETQLEIARRRAFGDPQKQLRAQELLDEIMKMLNKIKYCVIKF